MWCRTNGSTKRTQSPASLASLSANSWIKLEQHNASYDGQTDRQTDRQTGDSSGSTPI